MNSPIMQKLFIIILMIPFYIFAGKIHDAARAGDLTKVKKLLTTGSLFSGPRYVDERDSYKRTPLHLAAEGGHTEVVSLLLSSGANLDAQTSGSFSPFVGMKFTPLHSAAKWGRAKVVKLLINAGTNTDAQDSNKETPLHLAVKRNSEDIVRLLINAGASTVVVNINGKTALQSVDKSNLFLPFLFENLRVAAQTPTTSHTTSTSTSSTPTKLSVEQQKKLDKEFMMPQKLVIWQRLKSYLQQEVYFLDQEMLMNELNTNAPLFI